MYAVDIALNVLDSVYLLLLLSSEQMIILCQLVCEFVKLPEARVIKANTSDYHYCDIA